MIKIEDLKKIKLPPCWQCESEDTSVRYGGQGWYFVGCLACGNKRQCDEKYLPETIDEWRKRAEKVWARKKE